MTSIVCLVSFRSPHWLQVAVESFKEQFPGEKLLVVDNNITTSAESAFLRSRTDILYLPGNATANYQPTHGDGMDIAANYCREQRIEILTHIEPDCVISGTAWRTCLESVIDPAVCWLAAACWRSYGPLHPCPSSWLVEKFSSSFSQQPRAPDKLHPRYADFLDEAELRAVCSTIEWDQFFSALWDTAQKNWFYAATRFRSRCLTLKPEDGFQHYWKGTRSADFERIQSEHPELLRYVKQRIN